MISILLSMQLAIAQDDPAWQDCQNDQAIAGTAGFANAQAGKITNAQAYGAVGFAESRLFPKLEDAGDDGWTTTGGVRYTVTMGATHLPTLEGGGCPDQLRITSRALDLAATSFGVVASNGTFGIFYASSLAYGITPQADPRLRFMYHGAGFVYGTVGAAFAPVLPGTYRQGGGPLSTDYVIGGIFDADAVVANAGFVGSTGFYFDVRGGKLPWFATALLNQLSLDNYAKGGISRAKSKAGESFVFARNVPFSALPRTDSAGNLAPTPDLPRTNLTTGHIDQRSLGGILDVEAALAVLPSVIVHDAHVGLHTNGYHDGKAGALIQGGIVELPDLFFYGVEGGRKPQFRAEVHGAGGEPGEKHAIGHVAVTMNDADHLVLFPYAQGAVSVEFGFEGTF